MRPDPRVLLADVDSAAADIVRFSEGMNRETYVGDARTQAAVERKFEIIGEALNRLHQTCPEIAKRIPPLREVVGFRNLLIHGYAAVIPDRLTRRRLPESQSSTFQAITHFECTASLRAHTRPPRNCGRKPGRQPLNYAEWIRRSARYLTWPVLLAMPRTQTV